MREIITVEYNPLAVDEDVKQFHIDNLERTLISNFQNCLRGKCLHWVYIGF